MQRAQSTRADASPLLTAAASSAAQSGGACAVASGVEPSLRVGTMLVNSVAAKRVRLKRAFVISFPKKVSASCFLSLTYLCGKIVPFIRYAVSGF